MSTAKTFPVDKIVPLGGTLEGEISWDSVEEAEPQLTHSIAIELAPFTFDGRHWQTELIFDPIIIKVRSWRELAGSKYRFPNILGCVYADGEEYPQYDIYGSIRLLDDYHRVDATRIEFGEISNHRIPASIEAKIHFRNAAAVYGSPKIALVTELTIGAVAVRGDRASNEYPDLDEALTLARHFLNMDDYEDPMIDTCVKFNPKCLGMATY